MADVQYIEADNAHAVVCDDCGGNMVAYLYDPDEAADAADYHEDWHAGFNVDED